MDMNMAELASGAVQEKFNEALEVVVANMLDPNTPWKNKRVITLKVAITQNEDRNDTAVEISVEKKLAQPKPIVTHMAIGKDLDTGKVLAQEYGSQVRGQMSFDDLKYNDEPKSTEKVIDGHVVDTETGEVKDNVADFRDLQKQKQA